jgi:hypothetical protein
MSEEKVLVRYKCSGCGKWSQSNSGKTMCRKCAPKDDGPRKYCTSCGRKFWSQKGKEQCRTCMQATFNGQAPEYVNRKVKRLIEKSCESVFKYERDIKILATKMKWNLLSHIDLFRIANIYMDVVCDETKFSTYEADVQCQYMLSELMIMLQSDDGTYQPKYKAICRMDGKGNVLQRWDNATKASEELGVSRKILVSIAAGQKKVRRLFMKWESDLNI